MNRKHIKYRELNQRVTKIPKSALKDSMLQIYSKAKNSRLDEKFFEEQAPYIDFVCKKLSVSPIQAVYLSLFVGEKEFSFSDLVYFLGFSTIDFSYTDRAIRLTDELNSLHRQGFLLISNQKLKIYTLVWEVKSAIILNKTLLPTDYSINSLKNFFHLLDNIFTERYTFEDANKEIKLFIKENSLPNKIGNMEYQNLSDEERLLLFYFIYNDISRRNITLFLSELEDYEFFKSSPNCLLLLRNIESSALIKNELLERVTGKRAYRIKGSNNIFDRITRYYPTSQTETPTSQLKTDSNKQIDNPAKFTLINLITRKIIKTIKFLKKRLLH